MALVVSVLALAAGCRSEAKVDEEVVRPVKVAVVQAAARGRTLAYSGVVRARIESAIGFRVAGKVVQRAVNVGDRVEVDQVIARLDDTNLKLAESSARPRWPPLAPPRRGERQPERAKVLLPKATHHPPRQLRHAQE
jgi:multidrug efflux pump subunit AcrA (membrane-fusion protein)